MSRKERLKVYHGIPKSVQDINTLFYTDFSVNKISPNLTLIGAPTPIGDRFKITANNATFAESYCAKINSSDELTVDCLLDLSSLSTKESSQYATICGITDSGKTARYGHLAIDIKNNQVYYYLDQAFTITSSSYDQRYTLTATEINNKWIHVRYTIKDGTISIYVNGIKRISSEKVISPKLNAFIFPLICPYTNTSMSPYYRTQGTIAELHISKIDKGDVFYNLPTDFISGGALIKPRLCQQQIKGDPIYSQEVTVVIPPYVGESMREYMLNSDGSGNVIRNPEVINVRDASKWQNSANFTIMGLDGELIGGVFDSDTALCKITKQFITTVGVREATVQVDSTSKLSVGDTFRFVRVVSNGSFETGNAVITVAEIVDATTVKLSFDNAYTINYNIGDMFFEHTATTSSPLVKAFDGTVVPGTWTGLGTNKATFTISGNNTSLTGQSLYVTYSLNIPNGNSDFTELPYSINKVYDEVGNELVNVSEIIVVDDFNGKIPLSTKECPHKMYSFLGTTLKTPNDITGNYSTGFEEISTLNTYSQISTLDSICRSLSTARSSEIIPQQLISFNVVEIVERKIGTIPSTNKVQWLKDNISNIKFNLIAFGQCSTGNKLGFQWWQSDMWSTASRNHTYATPTLGTIILDTTPNIVKAIQTDGMSHFLVYTEASNGSVDSVINIDYVSLEISLRFDSSFTAFYSSNKRSREFPCNPVLIQKETKTVKRLIPSDKCFSTEYSYVLNAEPLSHAPILSGVKFKSIGLSTGEYLNSEYRLNFLPTISWHKSPKIVPYSAIGSYVRPVVTSSLNDLIWFTDNGANWKFNPHCEQPTYICVASTLNKTGGFSSASKIPFIYGTSDKNANVNQPILGYCLVRVGSELKIALVMSQKGSFYFYEDKLTFVNLPNRPLIK